MRARERGITDRGTIASLNSPFLARLFEATAGSERACVRTWINVCVVSLSGLPEPVRRATRGCSLQICNLLHERKLRRETKGLNLLGCVFMHKDAANDSASASRSLRWVVCFCFSLPKMHLAPNSSLQLWHCQRFEPRPKNKTSAGGLSLMQIF